jgi:hypothetical protein
MELDFKDEVQDKPDHENDDPPVIPREKLAIFDKIDDEEHYEIVEDDAKPDEVEWWSLFLGEAGAEGESALYEVSMDDWEDVMLTLTADSGAANHVLNSADIPGYTVMESEASKAGRGFVGPDGCRIPSEGEAELNLMGPQGGFRSTFQVAKVTRPLMSIARICDRGHKVIFEKSHATVVDLRGREVCQFARKGNLYMVDVTLKAPRPNNKAKAPGFARPAR